MKAQVQPYFQRQLVGPLPEPSDLAEYPTQLAPIIVDAMLTRRNRSFWASSADHVLGLQAINRYLVEILMGAKRDLIIEFRDGRGDYYGTITEKDPDIVPIGQYAGASLNDMLLTMREIPATDTVDEHLTALRAKFQEFLDGQVDPVSGETTLSTLIKILLALA